MAEPDATPAKQIQKGLEVLHRGGLVAYPTDTVYGLGANAFNEQAVAAVFRVKQRPLTMALPILIAEASQLDEVAINIPPIARRLAEKFWPGALTLVLSKSSSVPDIVTAGEKTVAVRVPAHPIPIALIRGLGAPIIGTSANVSGRPSPCSASEVREQLGNEVDLIIDGGRCPGGVESTIVDLTGDKPVILREGAIAEEVLKFIG